MSSALPVDPHTANQTAHALGEQITSGGGGVASMTPRQLELSRRYAYFRGSCYDGRSVDWNGDPITDTPYDTSGIGRQRDIPPGFTDLYGNTAPLKYRRPSAPYYLARVIVKRFTGLLFSHRKHPKVKVEGDPMTEDWLAAAIEAGRLWAQMIEARDLGGAMGSVAVGFEIHEGVPLFEVFDPRFATPTFKNRLTHDLSSIEVKWQYKGWIQDRTGEWVECMLWARRVIDEQNDTLWQDIYWPDDKEPDWAQVEAEVAPQVVEHGFGECPVEWIQNVAVPGEIDGDPDCHGAYDLFEEIDRLTSQANRGILFNCDPTLVIETDDELASIEKGSEKFIRVSKGERASYLEMAGSGPKIAMEQADRLEDKALRLVQCVLDQARSAVSKTATEVDRDYSSFYEKGDVLREQYGERGVKRLLAKLVRAAQMLEAAGQKLALPPKSETLADGTKKITPRKLGKGNGVLSFQWPGYTTPTVQDTAARVQAAANAVSSNLVDAEHGAQYLATDFQVEDVRAMLAAMKKAQDEQEAAYAAQTVGDATAPVTDTSSGDGEKFFQYEMEAGIVTINEMRASHGLPPLAMDGDLTVPQYRAKYQQTYAKSTVAVNETGAEKILGMGGDDESAAPPPSRTNGFGGAH